MRETSCPPEGFSIRRHAVQQLLRQALDAAPGEVHGLLGGHGHIVESVLALHATSADTEIRKALRSWHAQGIHPLATYRSQNADTHLPSGLLPDEESARLDSLPQLCIRTDTRGRIEADLLAPAADGGNHSCMLEMQEDGGLYPLVNKG